MKRSPARVIELCIYVLIIITAIVWFITGGDLYSPSTIPPPVMTKSASPSSMPPSVVLPKGEFFPVQ